MTTNLPPITDINQLQDELWNLLERGQEGKLLVTNDDFCGSFLAFPLSFMLNSGYTPMQALQECVATINFMHAKQVQRALDGIVNPEASNGTTH